MDDGGRNLATSDCGPDEVDKRVEEGQSSGPTKRAPTLTVSGPRTSLLSGGQAGSILPSSQPVNASDPSLARGEEKAGGREKGEEERRSDSVLERSQLPRRGGSSLEGGGGKERKMKMKVAPNIAASRARKGSGTTGGATHEPRLSESESRVPTACTAVAARTSKEHMSSTALCGDGGAPTAGVADIADTEEPCVSNKQGIAAGGRGEGEIRTRQQGEGSIRSDHGHGTTEMVESTQTNTPLSPDDGNLPAIVRTSLDLICPPPEDSMVITSDDNPPENTTATSPLEEPSELEQCSETRALCREREIESEDREEEGGGVRTRGAASERGQRSRTSSQSSEIAVGGAGSGSGTRKRGSKVGVYS